MTDRVEAVACKSAAMAGSPPRERPRRVSVQAPAVTETNGDRPDPREAARSAGLRYSSDSQSGIRRRRSGRGFGYTDADGKAVRDREVLDRIKALAIPPAWTDVWI